MNFDSQIKLILEAIESPQLVKSIKVEVLFGRGDSEYKFKLCKVPRDIIFKEAKNKIKEYIDLCIEEMGKAPTAESIDEDMHWYGIVSTPGVDCYTDEESGEFYVFEDSEIYPTILELLKETNILQFDYREEGTLSDIERAIIDYLDRAANNDGHTPNAIITPAFDVMFHGSTKKVTPEEWDRHIELGSI